MINRCTTIDTLILIAAVLLSVQEIHSRNHIKQTQTAKATNIKTTATTGANTVNATPNDELTLPERWDGEGPMKDALLYLTERSRNRFKDDCLTGKFTCTYDEVGERGKYRWNSNIHVDAKLRFWKVYECTLTKKKNECPINGAWSMWSDWNACSAKCGQGLRVRNRKCDNPTPKNNGFKCSGLSKQEKLCNGACIPTESDVLNLSSAQQEAYAILKAMHAEHPKLEAKCYFKHCPYRSVKHIMDSIAADTYWSALHCLKFGNACPAEGNWSEWSNWEKCSADCNEGIKVRTRECNNPAPTGNGKWCEGSTIETSDCEIRQCDPTETSRWNEWQAWGKCTKTCGGGVSIRRRECKEGKGKCEGEETQSWSCKTQRCPLKGQWSNWGAWNGCSRSCGLGVYVRDRTCSNPIPSGSGNICKGPGTEAGYCYKTPCLPKSENIAVFSGNGYIEYSGPFIQASRTLIVYIRFKPNTRTGVLYQSFHKPEDCKQMLKRCSNKVVLKLNDGLVVLESVMGEAKLTISTKVKVHLKKWNSVFFTLAGRMGTLSLNDRHRYCNAFSTEPSPDYNMPTLVGVGLQGALSKLTINFRDVSLERVENWKGYGAPVNITDVEFKPPEIEAILPEFNANTYTYIEQLFDTTNEHNVQFKVIIKPTETRTGYIVYNQGKTQGSYTYLQLQESTFKCCVSPGGNSTESCAFSYTINPENWYIVECTINGYQLEVRVDNNLPRLATFNGKPYHPKQQWFIGESPSKNGTTFTPTQTNVETYGFKGFIDAVVIGEKFHPMTEAVLVSSGGYSNSMGISSAVQFKDLYEPAGSIIMLRCSYSAFLTTNNSRPINVTWLKDTQFVRYDNFVNLEPDSPADRYVSVLKINPPAGIAHNYEGSYECLIFVQNQRFVLNAYGLYFKDKELGLEEQIVDKVEISISLIAIVLGAGSVVVIAIAIFITIIANKKTSKKEAFKGAFERFAEEVASSDPDEEEELNKTNVEVSAGSSIMSLARAAIKRDYTTPIPSGLSIGSYHQNWNINMSQRRSSESVNKVTSRGIYKYVGIKKSSLCGNDTDGVNDISTPGTNVKQKGNASQRHPSRDIRSVNNVGGSK